MSLSGTEAGTEGFFSIEILCFRRDRSFFKQNNFLRR